MCLKAQNEAVIKKYGEYRYDTYLSGINYLFDDSDYVLANLESPILGSPYTVDTITKLDVQFATPKSFLNEVKAAGINFVSTCNNHCLDRGLNGLVDTLHYINDIGIEHSGTYLTKEDSEQIFIKEIEGVKIAIICCTFGTNSQLNGYFLDEDQLWMVDLLKRQQKLLKIKSIFPERNFSLEKFVADDVSPAAITNSKNQVIFDKILDKVHKAKNIADIVIVYPHIGGQYNPSPGFYTRFVVNSLVDAGADIVVANHPHTSLRCEQLNTGVYCAYSLGNLAFTPDTGFFLDNVLAEYGIVFHTYWNNETKMLSKLNFNVTRCVVGEDGITRVKEVSELYKSMKNKTERERLMIDNESVVNRFIGLSKSFEPRREYEIL